MKLLILCVGKKHDASIATAIDTYHHRLSRFVVLEWQIITPSTFVDTQAKTSESRKILATIKPSDIVWLLDERGEQITSPALAAKLQVLKTHAISRLVIVIGGAYGVDNTVRERAKWVWSLSKLVFPHQLVRLMVAEQLYRASEIEKGSGYHHA